MTDADRERDAPSDASLIERWKRGDQRAATEIVQRHAPAVARFAAASGARGAAVDDLVQDTFVRAFGSIEGFRGDASLRTWLFTITRRLMVDQRRSERRRGEQVAVQDQDAVTEYDALDGLVANEMQGRLRGAIAQLTPTQRQVFVLRVTEGMSYREIAETVETTEGAARVHYHNAMRAVKEYLDA